LEIQGPPTPGVTLKGPTAGAPDPEFAAELITEIARQNGVGDGEIAVHFSGVVEKGIQNWRWVQAILRTLDDKLGDSVIGRFTRDVYAYLAYPAVRRAIDT